MSEQENVRIARTQIERLNRAEIGFVEEYEHKDAAIEGPGAASPMTPEQYTAYLQGYLDAFPDLHFDILETIAQGNYVVINWHATGTHTGPMRAPNGEMVPPTNHKCLVDGSTTYEFRDGKLARSKIFWDMVELLVQLGLMPQASQSA